MFSIILAAYNAEKTLKKCVDSVISQTEESWELIIIDDGSADSTAKIAQNYAANNKKIKVLIHENNCGQCCALNDGIEVSCGEYISFIDSDDWVTNKCYADRRAVIDGCSERPDMALFGYTSVRINQAIPLGFKKEIVLSGHDLVMTSDCVHTGGNLMFSWRMIFKRDFLQKNHLKANEKIVVGEDTDFNLRAISAAKTIIVSDEFGYFYDSTNTTSIMHTPYKKTFENDMNLQYETRSSRFMDIPEYVSDMAKYYVNTITFSFITNCINSPDGLTPLAMRRLFACRWFSESWKRIGFGFEHSGGVDLLLRLLLKFRMARLYCAIVNHHKK